jgi:hypothetical protein
MKPIHKFNDGRGATLCHKCRKIITEGMTDDLFCEEHGGNPIQMDKMYMVYAMDKMYTLIRERDSLTLTGSNIAWVEWNDNGRSKYLHPDVKIGRSLLLDPSIYYTWMTTTVVEIIEESEDCIKFRTKNSVYELKIKQKVI